MTTSPALDLATWPDKAEAAAALGISERSLDRLCEEGRGPEKRLRQRSAKRPEPVYNPMEIAALIAARNEAAMRVVPAEIAEHLPMPAASVPAEKVLSLVERITAMMPQPRQIEAQPATAPPVALFLTLDEASAYTGLSEAFLRRLIRGGHLPAVKDRGWKVARVQLDDFARSPSRPAPTTEASTPKLSRKGESCPPKPKTKRRA